MSTSDSIPLPTRDPAPRCLMATPEGARTNIKRRGDMKGKLFLAALTLMLLSGPLSAHANLIWDWTGDCQRILFGSTSLCTHAMVHAVTTDDYVPGEVFPIGPGPSTLIEWRYSDDLGVTRTITAPDFFLLPASSGPGEGSIDIVPAFFQSHADGTWRFESEGLSPD